MLFAIGRRHQHADIAAQHVLRRITEQFLSRRVVQRYNSAIVDDNDAVHRCRKKRTEQNILIANVAHCFHFAAIFPFPLN